MGPGAGPSAGEYRDETGGQQGETLSCCLRRTGGFGACFVLSLPERSALPLLRVIEGPSFAALHALGQRWAKSLKDRTQQVAVGVICMEMGLVCHPRE